MNTARERDRAPRTFHTLETIDNYYCNYNIFICHVAFMLAFTTLKLK